MNPEAALERQIERYRAMTGQQRLPATSPEKAFDANSPTRPRTRWSGACVTALS